MGPARMLVAAAALALTPVNALAGQDWSAGVTPSRLAGIPRAFPGFGNQVSCAAPGQCTAVMQYSTFSGETATAQVSVLVTQFFGIWGGGIRAPLPVHLGTPGVVDVASVSCAAIGDCTAVGSYRDASGRARPLIWTDASGAWEPAIEPAVPLDASGKDAVLTSVSCAIPRSCSASGSSGGGILLVSRTGGTWGPIIMAKLPSDAAGKLEAGVAAVSCGGRGSCSAVGNYTDTSGHLQGLLLDERSGRWLQGVKIELPDDAGFVDNDRVGVALYGLSCAAPGYCSATGSYPRADGTRGGLLLSRTPRGWARGIAATPPAGTNATTVLPFAVSCAEPAECSAVGVWDGPDDTQGTMLLSRTGRNWAPATEPPAPPGRSDTASYLADVSCGAPGDCAAVGWSYALGALLTETEGSWAMQVRAPAHAKGSVTVRSVSCPSAGHCAAAGDYPDRSNGYRPVLFTRGTAPTAPSRIEVRAAIREALTVEGREAAVPVILERGGFTAHVVVPGPGTERIVWSSGRLIVARAARSFTQAMQATVAVRLTPEGRALLARGGRVDATAFGVFTPARGRAVSARREITLEP